MITKRTFLRGLFAAPAIVAASSLMQIRGIRGELLILPEELNTAEIIALLERRIDAAMHQAQIAMSRYLYGDVHGSKQMPVGAPAHSRYDLRSLAVPLSFIPT